MSRLGGIVAAVLLLAAPGCECEGDDAPPPDETDRAPSGDEEDEPDPDLEDVLAAAADPVGSWRATSDEEAPDGRESFAAVLLGDRFVIWGGFTLDGQFQTYLNSGAILDAAANTWVSLPTDGAPSARTAHVAVGAGRALFIWGGRDGMNPIGTGAILENDRWREVAPIGGPPPAGNATGIWTGSEVIVWGGMGAAQQYSGLGARFDPNTNGWRPMSTLNAPTPRAGHTALWTGEEMIVWGGVGTTGSLGTGAIYDPADDSWTPLATEGAPSPRLRHGAVWTGSEMLVWGGDASSQRWLDDGAIWVAGENAWRPMDDRGAPSARSDHTAVWNGDRMIVWGGTNGTNVYATGGAFDPVANEWAPLSIEAAPPARKAHAAAWTGGYMVVWGGIGDTPRDHPNTGGIWQP